MFTRSAFTRSTARALLTNRVTIDNDKLPEDVLLEIFDIYRQLHELQPNYERVWNSRDGWFKLAHVCIHWRRVVFLSPSRLHVHLLFTPSRSPRAPMLSYLPPLPVFLYYSSASWTEKEVNIALAAINHRSRVRGIVIQRSRPCPARLLKALSHPFPELESLEIISAPVYEEGRDLILPTVFFSRSTSSLQRLTLREVIPEYLSPLLSFATGLVELALTLSIVFNALPEASLIANLQRMSHLRRLELKLTHRRGFNVTLNPPLSPASAGDVIPLSKLTDLILTGHGPYLQMIVVNLAAPSLQRLNVEIWGPRNSASPVPRLCKFICDAEYQFVAVCFDFSYSTFNFSAETCPQSSHVQPFRIIIPRPVSLVEIGVMLSGPLSTAEELVVGRGARLTTQRGDHIQWRGFFNYIRRVKTVQLPPTVALDFARSFQLDGQEPAPDLLPALEQVKGLCDPLFSLPTESSDFIRDAFEPLVAARKQGRPIRLSLP